MAKELHCDVPCVPVGEALGKLWAEVNHKTSFGVFLTVALALFGLACVAYVCVFAFATASAQADAAVVASVVQVKLETTREIGELRTQQAAIVTRLDAVTKALEANTRALEARQNAGS